MLLKLLKGLTCLLLFLVLAVGLVYGGTALLLWRQSVANLGTLGPQAPQLLREGLEFRDLNKNGQLDRYEDYRLAVELRVDDLLGRMTLAEKIGLMFITPAAVGSDGGLQETFPLRVGAQLSEYIGPRHMNHFNIMARVPASAIATWYNAVQALAERTRLGIPVTIASDPRHGFNSNPLAGMAAHGLSKWPEPLGLAASRDLELIRQFGDIARQEYLAIGIRLALHPLADLATEPRWARISHTVGEDAELSAKATAAYIRGFQGERISPHSVMNMTKHFPGAGPQKDGEDAHFPYGREQVYPGNNFDYHLRPFEAALAAGSGQIMTYYGMPVGLEGVEPVGFGFNRDVVTGLLRQRYGFDGVVCTDWHLLTPSKLLGFTLLPAKAWGVEELDLRQRMLKIIDAGADQFGGQSLTHLLLELVESGQVPESRIDQSAQRLLRDKFRLGLFDDPYVNVSAVGDIVGRAEFVAAGESAQRKAYVLLKNGRLGSAPALPLSEGRRLYVEGIAPALVARYGTVVDDPARPDVALLRLGAPFEPRDGLMEKVFHAGYLDFRGEEKARLLGIINTVPTVVDMFMERPAVIPEIAAGSAALLANFGATDKAALDVIFGAHPPTGKLPFEMARSMAAVEQQKEDLPYDSQQPLYPYGHGLHYQ